MTGMIVSASITVSAKTSTWDQLLKTYLNDEDVNQLIFVKYKGHYKADFILYKKERIPKAEPTEDSTASEKESVDEFVWKKTIKTTAYVGRKGIGKKREGDKKTPTGTFKLTCAFGRLSDPGAKMKYKKLNKYLYWCGDKKYYNRMIDTRKQKHRCHGEHLIKYKPQYDYCMNIGYNKKGVYKKGSAIFLHCTGSHKYTLGCVAIPKKYMKKVLKTCDSHTRICIYKK